MEEHAIIAFDGLSLAGKSTMVEMLFQRSTNARVIRENTYDPIRPATSKLNKLFKSGKYSFEDCLEIIAEDEEFANYAYVAVDAGKYVENFHFDGSGAKKQAALAYFFTAGRKVVNDELIKQFKNNDVILDRWFATGCAYQTFPPDENDDSYSWERIRELNEDMGIWYPHMQFLITLPEKDLDQIAIRKAYRQKQGVGTAGQMSSGREKIIYNEFRKIERWFSENGVPVVNVENRGTPSMDLQEQIEQAIPAYLKVESELRQEIEKGMAPRKYGLAKEILTPDQAKEFFLEPEMMNNIHERQTSKN